MKTKISILGCGWLGLPLGEFLAQNNFEVKGATTSKKKLNLLEEKSIKPYQIIFDPELQTDAKDFFDSEILILNIPPKRSDDKINHTLKQINAVIDEIKKTSISKVIFISSTSVYGEEARTATEESEINPDTDSAKAVAESENLLRKSNTFLATIIRLGGLIGNDRNPVKYFAGRKDIPGGNAPVNLIHLDDCIGIIHSIINKEIWGEIFNAVSPSHPSRKEFYAFSAEKLNLPLPHFIEEGEGKIVSPEKLIRNLGYSFIHKDLVE